jgi:hypothetical protein
LDISPQAGISTLFQKDFLSFLSVWNALDSIVKHLCVLRIFFKKWIKLNKKRPH